MMRALLAVSAMMSLGGCSILFPEDPRLGTESSEECAARVPSLLGPGTSYDDYTESEGVPTFTYDITKVGLEDIQALMVEGSDDTAGRRLMEATNETSTAVAQFMAMSVDEKGAFFMAVDPALYRVRGNLQAKDAMIESGCAMQKEGMRLIMIDVAPEQITPNPENSGEEADDTENET